MENTVTRRRIIKQGSLAALSLILPLPLLSLKSKKMNRKEFDVIIVGGSYAGLSSAMALGRSLRNVLVIDSGSPCNKQAPHSHNFITQDGEKPSVIADKARKQVLAYPTVKFLNDLAIKGQKNGNGFEVTTQSGKSFKAKKLVFATGVKDVMPDIPGFAECWGISIIHCPYCHGYEVRHQATGILANGEGAFHYAEMISNWTKDLTIFTNGKCTLSEVQIEKISKHNIHINERVVASIEHSDGNIHQVVFQDGSKIALKALYARPDFVQHCDIPQSLGCELTEQNHIRIDAFQKTNIPGIFACGDNTTMMRSVSNAVSMGAVAGSMVNREIIMEEF